MSKIFLIAGLGADTRVYKNIELHNHEIIKVDWVEPDKNDTLAKYSQKLVYQYHITPGSIIIGNSLGGMIGIEIGKVIPLKKLILISSIKTITEAPFYFALFRAFPVYKLIPGTVFTSMGFFIRIVFGKMKKEDRWLFNNMLKNSSPVFVKWAMGAALYWDNKTIPANTFTITGNKDMVFNYKRIKDATLINGGTHIMIFDRAIEINILLKQLLNK